MGRDEEARCAGGGSGLGVQVREGGVAGKVKTWLEMERGLVRFFESKVQQGTWISHGPGEERGPG